MACFKVLGEHLVVDALHWYLVGVKWAWCSALQSPHELCLAELVSLAQMELVTSAKLVYLAQTE